MKTNLTLTNFKIIKRQDIKGNDYYIIFDNNGENGKNAYFCWEGTVKEGWDYLQNYETLKEIEIAWEWKEKGNRVIGIYSNDEFEFLI